MLSPRPLPPAPAETAQIARRLPEGASLLGRRGCARRGVHRRCVRGALPAPRSAHARPVGAGPRNGLQFAEGRSDRQAADAVRGRLDWKYVLRLGLDDADFDASVLCTFRGRIVEGGAAWLLFETVLAWARTRHLLKARGQQRTDATHVCLTSSRKYDRLASSENHTVSDQLTHRRPHRVGCVLVHRQVW